jgi:hypothetical protein
MAKRRRVVKKVSVSGSSNSFKSVGHWTFLIGAALAVLGAFFTRAIGEQTLLTVLFVLGVVVGFLNIRVEETTGFLVATIALILAGVVNLGLIPVIGVWLRLVLSNIVVFVVPAAVIVALRAVWVLASEE